MSLLVGVTGSHGFVGSALVDAGRRRGFDMRQIVLPRDLTRLPPAALAEHMPPERFDLVINAAAVRHPKRAAERFLNARGPAWLRDALDARTRLLHVSSLNVLIPDAADGYARTKAEGELGLAGRSHTIVLRPSLVWDPAGERGVARQIHRAVRSIPFIVPVPRPGATFRPADIADLAESILDFGAMEEPPAVGNLVGERRVTLHELFCAVADHHGKRTLPLPLEAAIPRPMRKFLPRLVRAGDPELLRPPPGLERGLDRLLPRCDLVR